MDIALTLCRSIISFLPGATILTKSQPIMEIETQSTSVFHCLPAEIIANILSFLPPAPLARLSTTCRLLHSHCNNDLLWAEYVQANVPFKLASPYPSKTWRELYLAHHPYWFLTRHKLWFADRGIGGATLTGSLILARFDIRTGCIEAYRLLAEHGKHTFESWNWNSDVIIHTFNPLVHLWLDDPVVKLDHAKPNNKKVREELRMSTSSGPGISSALSLCKAIPESSQHRSMALWPPTILPAKHRVRSESGSMFRDVGHKPKTLEEASDQTFRIRRWFDHRRMNIGFGSIGEDVMTFSTLLEEVYTPTKQKPWQGIWVGDYSGHGCEFLVVLQRDIDPNSKPIRAANWTIDSPNLTPYASSDEEAEAEIEDDQLSIDSSSHPTEASTANPQLLPVGSAHETRDDPSCRGRLEAIKLTGDPNVPRGEYTWIAEDIGEKGLVRVAHEQMFKGARVVKSVGHCAARNFRNGKLPEWISFSMLNECRSICPFTIDHDLARHLGTVLGRFWPYFLLQACRYRSVSPRIEY